VFSWPFSTFLALEKLKIDLFTVIITTISTSSLDFPPFSQKHQMATSDVSTQEPLSVSTEPKFIKVTVESWSPVAIYAPEVTDLECHICRSNLTEVCATCIQVKNIETQRCPISKGDCNHAFHQHCIRKWLTNGDGVCPVDKTTWHCRVEDVDAHQIRQQLVKVKTAGQVAATTGPVAPTGAGAAPPAGAKKSDSNSLKAAKKVPVHATKAPSHK